MFQSLFRRSAFRESKATNVRFSKKKMARHYTPRVEALEERMLLATGYTVTNTNDSGTGSLRAAINASNSAGVTFIISFNIVGTGVHTINPLSQLPTIHSTTPHAVVINGTTQPGYSGTPLIEIKGNGAPLGSDGFLVTGGHCAITGLIIDSWTHYGIHLQTAGSNTIIGNYIGTDPAGTQSAGNSYAAVAIDNSPSNTIGGSSSANRNILSGSQSSTGAAGVAIFGSTSTNNTVVGNYIGTDVTGFAAIGNQYGVSITSDATNNTIGGTSSGQGNLIAGNTEDQVYISANNTKVLGNTIGSNNVTSAGDGVFIVSASNNLISGNVIQFNGSSGIFVNGGSSNTIGGTASGAGNTIHDNGQSTGGGDGVDIEIGTMNGIRQNSIYNHNNGLGIQLIGTGNNQQAAPTLSFAGPGGVTGTLQSAANTTYTIEFFSNDQCNPSGFGEGQNYLGNTTVMTDGSGNASFSVPYSISAGKYASATATDPNQNTSQFSNCLVSSGASPSPGPGHPSVIQWAGIDLPLTVSISFSVNDKEAKYIDMSPARQATRSEVSAYFENEHSLPSSATESVVDYAALDFENAGFEKGMR